MRPHLEYCVQVWNPYLARDIDILEKVQTQSSLMVYQVELLMVKKVDGSKW